MRSTPSCRRCAPPAPPPRHAHRPTLHARARQSFEIHWLSIINSFVLVLLLTGFLAIILMRVLKNDFSRYTRDVEAIEEDEEETGWKLVHGDVFRPPANPMLLSVLVGTGVQTFTMTVITMIFAVLGFLSPANRGGLMTAMLLLFVFMGIRFTI